MTQATIIIKKYGNRRLYDTSGSRYINLEDIAALIRKGTDLKIVDARTGADLTALTLTQIIAEDAKQRPSGLSLELLRQLIITSDHAGQEFINWYLKSAFDTYQKVQGSLQDRLSKVGSAALSPLQTVKDFLRGPAAPEAVNDPAAELAELRQRLAELEARQPKRAAKAKSMPAKKKFTPAKKKRAHRH